MVIIDCGHGGRDPGAIGLFGIKEKDINLAIGSQLAKLLRSKGFNVFMTRESDIGISLEQRVKIINRGELADLLVSIHANSSGNCMASGIETFCLWPSLFRSVFYGVDKKCFHYMNKRRVQNDKKSLLFAKLLQQGTASVVKKDFSAVVDRGVKHAVARMLLGVDIPGALIEVGFLTHEKEAKKLICPQYQSLVAQGIYRSVVAYFENEKRLF